MTISSAVSWEKLVSDLDISQDGNLSVYIDNSSSDNVYFDEFIIERTEATRAVVVQENHYYPFGMNMKGIEELDIQSLDSKDEHRFQYNGKEKEESFGLYWTDYGWRNMDTQLGRFTKIDRFSEKYYSSSSYHYVLNNPISNIDVNGDWTVSVHYDITSRALANVGVHGWANARLAHYASVFADHPHTGVTIINNMSAVFGERNMIHKSRGIEYYKTKNSQITEWNVNSQHENYNIWHSMRSPWETDNNWISAEGARMRGLNFGWNKIFEAASSGKPLKKLIANRDAIENLGQGLHALQDVDAHKGVDIREHSALNDTSNGDDRDVARERTAGAITAYKLLTKDYEGLGNKISVNTEGMSKEQKQQLLDSTLEYLKQK